MRVLHYIPSFSVTTETFIYDQVVELQRSGVESAVLTAKRLNEESRPFVPVYLAPVRTVINERFTQAFALRLQLLPYMIDYRIWARVINEFKPDVIHCHTGNAVKTWMHVNDKLGLNIPCVASLHGSDVNSEPLIREKYRAALERAGRKDFIKWTVPSKFLKCKTTQNLNVPSEKIEVVHNAFNSMFLKEKQNISFECIRMISIGRFIRCKGHEFLIEALSLILQIYPNASLTLVGGGPLEERLKEQASKLGISSQVQFIENVSHEKIPSILGLHNVYIQPSIKDEETFQEESFGVAALEAMASGLATVVFECGGLTELADLVDTPAVKVIPQKNINELAKAITHIFESKLVVSQADRVRIGDLFSSTMNTSQILRIYNELTQ